MTSTCMNVWGPSMKATTTAKAASTKTAQLRIWNGVSLIRRRSMIKGTVDNGTPRYEPGRPQKRPPRSVNVTMPQCRGSGERPCLQERLDVPLHQLDRHVLDGHVAAGGVDAERLADDRLLSRNGDL